MTCKYEGFIEDSKKEGDKECKLFQQLSKQGCNFEIGDSSDAHFCAVCNKLHTAALIILRSASHLEAKHTLSEVRKRLGE